jgi:hypothetical protein
VNSKEANVLPGPESEDRPESAALLPALARLRSAAQGRYWDLLEYLESAAARRAGAVLVAGLEKHSGAPLRSLYFGSGHQRAYLLGLVYREHRLEQEHRDLKSWQARRWVEQSGRDVDLVLADLPWPYDRLLRGRGAIESPAWVNQRLALPARWQELLGRFRRSARTVGLRNIRSHRLQYRLVGDAEAVRRFYHEMYVPHMTRRFGEAAYIEPESKVEYFVDRGTLMEICQDGKVVAAQVLWGNRDSLRFLWNGIAGDELGSQSQGIYSALYYFGILHAFESGHREVDYSGTRPLLSDGVFQLKRRWGGRVHDGWSRDSLFIQPRNLGAANLAFLANNPLIARCRGELIGKMIAGAGSVGPEQVALAARSYATPGIRAIRIYSLQPPQPAAWDAVRRAPGIELVDLSEETQPAAAFCR